MKHSFFLCIFLLMPLSSGRSEMDMDAKRLMPDTIFMNDGKVLHGLILRNDAQKVTLQQKMGEVEIPKSGIRRIDDEADVGVYFSDIVDLGTLPPWRMIVQDLRTDDSIKSFRQIPATTIDNGYLKNIPYLSFRINDRVEMNVYGDPNHPVCIEYGIYERGNKITQFKKIVRAYLAGILTNRKEVGALYSLDEKGGQIKVGNFIFQVTPPDAPDTYGGWWIAIYDPARLEKARIPDALYRKVTLPFDEVNNRSGRLRLDRIITNDQFLTATRMNWNNTIPDLRGFYRNRVGDLELLVPSFMKKKPSATPQP
jgi:hypothetical protein